MKIDGGLVIFAVLFLVVIAVSMALGSYNPMTPAIARGQAQLTLGDGWTTGISTAFNWIFKLAVGGIFTGFGVAAFNEARKAYKLWKRTAQAGRWQAGPNANFQRQPAATKFNKQDMLLLALSGRLPGLDTNGNVSTSSTTRSYSTTSAARDEDELDIEM